MSTINHLNEMPKGICVLVDGGCLNNNKPVSERSMYGSWTVLFNGRQIVSQLRDDPAAKIHHETYTHDGGEHASNQLAELLALSDALTYAGVLQGRMNERKDGAKLTITILSDSEYALGHAQTWKPDKRAHQDTFTASEHLKKLAAAVREKGADLHFQHVNNLLVKTILGH